MVLEQAFMLRHVISLDRQISPIHRLCAVSGAEKINEGLRLVFCGEPAEPMLRHAGGRVPEGEVDRAALVNA